MEGGWDLEGVLVTVAKEGAERKKVLIGAEFDEEVCVEVASKEPLRHLILVERTWMGGGGGGVDEKKCCWGEGDCECEEEWW